MNNPLDLSQYAETPLYNIGAVVQATDLTSATLRAWERRYNVCSPERSDGGYRLYSERDIAALRWLKERVDEGMTISRAAARLMMEIKLRQQMGAAGDEVSAITERTPAKTSFTDLQETLLKHLLRCDEIAVQEMMAETFALYGVEHACEEIIEPLLKEVDDKWQQGESSSVAGHFAISYWRRKLHALLDASATVRTGQPILVGCAPGEWSEVGALQLTLFLRRRGQEALYLGQNVPLASFVDGVKRLQPRLVCLSANTEEAAGRVMEVASAIASLSGYQSSLGFSGSIFNTRPELRSKVTGLFLGKTGREAVLRIETLLQGGA